MSFALLIFLYRTSSSSSSPGCRFAFSISLISNSRKASSRFLCSSFIFMEPSSVLHLLYSLYARDTFSFAGRIFSFPYASRIASCLSWYRSDWCSCCPWISKRHAAAAFIWPTVLVSPLILLMLLPSMIFLDRSTCPSSGQISSAFSVSSAFSFSTWKSSSTSA